MTDKGVRREAGGWWIRLSAYCNRIATAPDVGRAEARDLASIVGHVTCADKRATWSHSEQLAPLLVSKLIWTSGPSVIVGGWSPSGVGTVREEGSSQFFFWNKRNILFCFVLYFCFYNRNRLTGDLPCYLKIDYLPGFQTNKNVVIKIKQLLFSQWCSLKINVVLYFFKQKEINTNILFYLNTRTFTEFVRGCCNELSSNRTFIEFVFPLSTSHSF